MIQLIIFNKISLLKNFHEISGLVAFRTMSVIYTSDLHGNKDLYLELFELAEQKKARAIIIGGDMLPFQGPIQDSLKEQKDFIFDFLEPQLEGLLSKTLQATCYAMLGNYDWQGSQAHLRSLEDKGLLRLMHAKKNNLAAGYELIGYAHVPPTPFLIKDNERRDLQNDAVNPQRGTACRSAETKLVVVDPLLHFAELPSIEEELNQLPMPDDLQRSVYVMHAPPFKTKLDIMDDGRFIGSRAIRAFIAKTQPYLTLHGHIHESMEMSGAYLDRIGQTICINPGQSTEELYAVIFDIEDVSGTIEHTVFGKQKR